jgi:Pyridoxamine 5'-phosphate oxidase
MPHDMNIESLIRIQAASYGRAQTGLRKSWARDCAMDAEEMRAFLDSHRYCVLATASSEGHPVARPVAFTAIDASFWLATVAADGRAIVIDAPDDAVLGAWEAHHGGRADWAAAWFEIHPVRLVSYSARRAPEDAR